MTSNPEGHEPALDGIRALAVIAVVLFHAGVPGAAGGFVGVDVFFVLSGYLITGVLLREYATTSRISIADFYARRARRIVPALVIMLATVLVLAWRLTPNPASLQFTAATVVTSSAFSQNLWLMLRTVDYFREPVTPGPLTHTWSLSVEEQFYLVWPLLVLLALSLKRNSRLVLHVVLGSIFVGSLGIVLLRPGSAVEVFYSPVARAWELGLGAVLAVLPPPRNSAFAARLAPIGLIAVILASSALDSTTVLHPWLLLAPTFGAAAMIYSISSAPGTWSAGLLRTRPLVWVGERSYGWYLWHFPAIIFARVVNHDSSSLLTVAIVASLVVAHLSYEFVEMPVRRQSFALASTTRRTLFAAGFALALVGGGGLFVRGVFRDQGITARDAWLTARCPGLTRSDLRELRVCPVGSTDPAAPAVLLWGDSYAHALVPLLDTLGRALRFRVIVETRAGCKPGGTFTVAPNADVRSCRRSSDSIFAAVAAAQPQFAGVVLAARWSGYFGVMPRDTSTRAWYQERWAGWDSATRHRLGAHGVTETVGRLASAGTRVLLVGMPPQWRHSLYECTRIGMAACADPDSVLSAYNWLTFGALQRAAAGNARVQAVDLIPSFCSVGTCSVMQRHVVASYDGAHISTAAAISLVSDVRCEFYQLAFGSPLAGCQSRASTPTFPAR